MKNSIFNQTVSVNGKSYVSPLFMVEYAAYFVVRFVLAFIAVLFDGACAKVERFTEKHRIISGTVYATVFGITIFKMVDAFLR